MASQVAEAISSAIDSTTNHAELIDSILAVHAELSCSYCNEITFKGRAIDGEKWSDAARKAMTDHVLSCAKRPEAVLTNRLVDALKYANMALVSLRAEDYRTVKSTIEDMIRECLTPKA